MPYPQRPKKTNYTSRTTPRRIEGAFYAFGLLFLGVSARVIYLQVAPPAARALSLSNNAFDKRQELPARRGQILATDGTALAVTLDYYTIAANPRAWSVAEKDRAARLISGAVGVDEAEIRAQLNRTSRSNGAKNYYVKLAVNVPEERMAGLRKLMGPQDKETRKERAARKDFWSPLDIEATPRRHYPMDSFAPQLIGFTTNGGKGVDGMEAAFNADLGGTDGFRESLVDARGRAVPGTIENWKEPIDGRTVVTTIDPKIQDAADRAMQTVFEKYHPNFCVAVVMKPQTGEIVAVSTAPMFNLNNRPKDIVDLATNRAFSYAYEPGSTWKMITAAASVENVPDWESKRFTITGALPIGKHTLHDWQFWSGHSKTDVKGLSEGIRDSSNICMYHFAQLMPRHVLLDYAKKFGVGDRPEIPGFNMHAGWLPKTEPKDWSTAQYANFSFGQGMMITPLQLARMGSVIANDGVLMKPLLVKEVRDARGQVVEHYSPQVDHRAIKVETARAVQKMMRRVISEGTAKRYIFIPGYAACGKTGSAQKAVGKSGYRAGKFISSFVGFLPYDPNGKIKARYVIAIMADEPKASHWGGETCGPPFDQIAKQTMVAMRLEEGTSAPAPNPNLMVRSDEKPAS